jgi:hypothetical protein
MAQSNARSHGAARGKAGGQQDLFSAGNKSLRNANPKVVALSLNAETAVLSACNM